MKSTLGTLAALGTSVTWAYASTRYAQASRTIGSMRVNVRRALVVVPLYAIGLGLTAGRSAGRGLDGKHLGWLLVSVICSYTLADSLFFSAARRIGITTALSVASTYPLWAALAGWLVGGEPLGAARAVGTLLCVGGVAALLQLEARGARAGRRRDPAGIALALLTSLLWAGNSASIKAGADGLSVWQANLVRYAMTLPLLWVGLRVARARSTSPDATTVPSPEAATLPSGTRSLLPAILADAFFGSILYVYGLSHTDLAVGATLSSLAPLISVPLAILLGEESWSAGRFAAIAATVVGIIALVTA